MAQRPPSDNRFQSDSINFSALSRNHIQKLIQTIEKGKISSTPSQPVSTTTTSATTNPCIGTSTSTASSIGPIAPTTINSTTTGTNISTASPVTTTQVVTASNVTQNSTTAPTPTTTTKKLTPIYALPFNGPKVEKFDTTKFIGFKFVLLDQFVIETPKTYEEVSGTYQWEPCQDQVGRCEEYIRDECAKKRVFLVASGGLGAQLVPKIHNLPQLYAVYVHCSNVTSHMEWALKYSKVRMVCDNDEKYLVPQLALDVAQSNLEWAVELLKTGDKVKAKKKLDVALANVEKYAEILPYPDLTAEIKRRIEECK